MPQWARQYNCRLMTSIKLLKLSKSYIFAIRVPNSADEQQKKTQIIQAFSDGPITHSVVSPYPFPTEDGEGYSLRSNVGS